MSETLLQPPIQSGHSAAFREAIGELSQRYPFDSHFLSVPGGTMHYLDEGAPDSASEILMLHGNPTWCFFYRELVRGLSAERGRRIVVPDHVGCGLSSRPRDFAYSLEAHVENLVCLVEKLDLRRLTLVLHDWGGAIGMGLARRCPERVKRLVILNTAAFPDPHIPLRIRIFRTPLLGRLSICGLNLFAWGATWGAVTRPLPEPVRRAYLAPYDSFARRFATWAFVRDIPMHPRHPSWPELAAIDEAIETFTDRPTCIVWGEQDFCFTPHFRRLWQERLPRAEVHRLEEAGHYLLEDAPEEALACIENFLKRNES